MQSHIRINITANWQALQVLTPTSYKILMSLAARADCYGVCFPSVERQAFDTNLHTETVYKAIDTLLKEGYIKILRQPHYDPLKRRKTPSVYQVSPDFLELAEQFLERAIRLWNNLTFDESTLEPCNNQQQNYVPEQSTKEPLPETTTTTAGPEKTENREVQNKNSNHKRNADNEVKNRERSAIVKKYTNPDFVLHPLEDLQEQLAEKLSRIEIKIPLARGLIVAYGYSKCELAYNYLQHTLKTQEIDNPAAFYRYSLQSNVAEMLPSLKPKGERDYTGGQYADFVETGNSRRGEYDDYLES